MNWLITNFISAFLLPPLNLLVLLAFGAALLHTRLALLGRRLIWFTLALLYLLSTPLVGQALISRLQPPYVPPGMLHAQAIVVLGGGVYHDAPEYFGDTAGSSSLERLRYAARLQRGTGLPLLTSGGSPEGGDAEGLVMWNTLRADFGVDTRWVEITSLNTAESAKHSYAILHAYGIQRILLVTHAWHMPRAQAAFERAGFTVLPAPTMYVTPHALTVLDVVPSARGLLLTRTALHEWIGMLWYRLKGSD